MAEARFTARFDPFALQKQLKLFREASREAMEQALNVVAQELLRDARLYVPVLTGQLRLSGRVEDVPTYDQALTVVRVRFGGLGVPYAAIQHEKPFWHPSLGFYGPAKYLEKPLEENFEFYQNLFVAELSAILHRKL